MNRDQRRRAAAAAARRPAINWATEPPDLCPAATKVIRLAQALDQGWFIDPRPCDKCRRYTTVGHLGEMVFACLACGNHGTLGDDGLPEPESTHTADGMRIQ